MLARIRGFFARLRSDPEERHAEDIAAASRASEVRFRSLTALSADWFWESDPEHRITWLTGGAAVVQLLSGSSSYGKRLWELPRLEGGAATEALRRNFLREERFHDVELVSCAPDGTQHFHVISGEPRFDQDGKFCGFRGVGRDMTERRSSENALQQAKQRLELAVAGGRSAIWELDMRQGRAHLGEGWVNLLGPRAAAVSSVTSERGLERAHPEDRETLHQAFVAAIKNQLEEFRAEVRFQNTEDDWKWLLVVGRVTERDGNGRALRLSGMAVDIDARKRAEQASRDAEKRYRSLVDLSPDGVVVSCGGYLEYANAAAARLFGASQPTQLLGRRMEDLVHGDERGRTSERLKYLRAGPGSVPFEERKFMRLDGTELVVEVAAVSYMEGGRLVLQTVFRDTSAAREARDKLAEREQRFRDIVEASGEYVWETDARWRYTYLSARVEAVLGFSQAEMLGRSPREFMTLGETRAVDAWFEANVKPRAPFRALVHRSMTKSGRLIWQSINGTPMFDKQGSFAGYRGTGQDITAQRQAEERIQFLATRDALTGLPNRQFLRERGEQAVARAAHERAQLALITLDLERFKLVNDAMGHAAGDALLRAVGERLSNTLRRQDTLARAGGDEFVLLWDGLKSQEEADAAARRIQDTLAQPFTIDGRSLGATAALGIATYPRDGTTFTELLKHSNLAAAHAKAQGRNRIARYAPDMGRRGDERLALENDLREALMRGELVLHYQPVVSGRADGAARVVGAEVLVRWQHPRRGLLMPDAFIAVAEEIGLIRAIGEWTIDRAIAQVGAWGSLPGSPWFAINVSAQELAEGPAFVARLAGALAKHGVAGKTIELEVTERALMSNVAANIETLQQIGAQGVRLAIDDFGTGYSSLAYLRRLPVDKLKIDQSFVHELATNRDDAVIVETIASMAKNLGLHVAAEGVESDAQLERLLALGCAEWQGHRYSTPLDAPAFEALLRGSRAAAAAS
jgi:diguanylate cyclase (GGDEF)-like protein/PAS domain S-box-containing protein